MLTDEIGGLEAAREALARERLEELQALARTYRSWSVKELAHALGRQPGRLIPESGMPKIDLVVALAKALDWPVEAVVEHLVKPASDARRTIVQDSAADFARLYNESLAKRVKRDFAEAVRLAVRAGAAADTPTRQAAALSAEAAAHEAAGCFTESVRCLRHAVLIDGVAIEWRMLCDAKLANMLFMQGQPAHALGIASSVLEYLETLPLHDVAKSARAMAYWARGHALRASIPLGNCEPWTALAQNARADFVRARDIVGDLADGPNATDCHYGTMAASIDAVQLELDALCAPESAEQVIRALVAIVREEGTLEPTLGERKAWAAIALANTAKRFLEDEMQRRGILEIASATLRAHAIATSNWYFAHQHLELDAERRRKLAGNAVAPRALDAIEAKLVAGVLGQVPAARLHASAFMALYGQMEGSC
ncbi:MAG: hypothetical protein QM516_05925 [Limnohabitans sp.]|jgi:hypothetical protein|nr:hypothetical protein [Limnohabitans sp.]